MTKHGISNCSDLSQHQLDTIAQEENWRIMADILYSEENDDRYALTIPLRILARYRTVAWKKYNRVTGQKVPVRPIGCPGDRTNLESSSDL